MTRYAMIAAALLFVGCGPMMGPMTIHLDPDQQKQVDGMWNNMLTPPDRLDREVLIDVLCEDWLFQVGVDHLHLVSEKQLDHGRVLMEIDCDRACPPSDQFTFTLLDERGKTLRRERYNRPEIEERVAFIHPDRNAFNHYGPTTLPSEDPAHTEARRREIECRMERIRAATQPAR